MLKNFMNIGLLLSLLVIPFRANSAANIENDHPLEKDLSYLAMNNQFDKLKLQIKLGVNINSKNEYGRTALIGAVSNGHKDIVKFLLDNNADSNIIDNLGHTALMDAVNDCNCNQEIIELLVNKADINYYEKSSGRSILIQALHSNCPKEIINLLLNKGADVNHVSCAGHSPLMWAAHVGNIDSVKLLLEAGADIDHVNDIKETAIDWANRPYHQEVIQLLQKTREDKIKERRVNIKNAIDAMAILPSVLSTIIAEYAVINYTDIPLVERKSFPTHDKK